MPGVSAWLKQRWDGVWRLIGGVNLRVKIAGIILPMIALLGLGLAWQVRATMARVLMWELEQRGVYIAEDLVDHSLDLILIHNTDALRELLQDTVAGHDDVQYAFLLDPGGQVLAHSFEGDVPADRLQADPVRPDQRYRLEMLQTAGGQVQDIAVPILEGRVGIVHVGMSLHRLEDTLSGMTRRILLTTLWVTLLAMVVTTTATWLFTRPMLALAEAIRRTARGDLSQRLVPWADDEIGLAQGAFNVMVERLAHFRHEMESAHDRLLRRNRELAALNAISRAIAGPLALTDVLERALQQAMGLVRAGGGWICLLSEDDACRVGVSAREPFRADIGTSYCQKCPFCREAARTRQPVVVAPLPPECPLHATRGIDCHAIVPLLVKDQAVGLLSLICGAEDRFEAEDLSLLVELGRQLGVAIENARLWEELRNKEALRGQLLHKIITAQEEERRRISRELHDEAGQALTSLLIGLKTMERAEGVDQMRAMIADLREVLNQTLDGVHDLAVELRPSVLDDLGLVPALARYVSGCSGRFGFEADFETAGMDGRRLPPEVEITLYRIAQETLTNVARHANASHASVLLQRRKGAVVLVVEDDGEGFDVDRVMASAQERKRLGLYGVEERALLVGGLLTIESRPGAGTTVSVEIPLEGVWSAREGTEKPRETHPSAS